MAEKARGVTGRWATGWYARRRHVVNEARPSQAVCDQYTGLYPDGRESGAKRDVPIPRADSPEVLALPACKRCLRIAAAPVEGES